MEFKDLRFQAKVRFANGFEVSVIKDPRSYPWEHLYEVLYDTPPTGEVGVGSCTPNDVTELLAEIEAMPAAQGEIP